MALFAQECYARFNCLSTAHFEDTEWTLQNDWKKNVVRIWQKTNEYKSETSGYKRAMNALTRMATFLSHFISVSMSVFIIFMTNSYFWADYLYGQQVYFVLLVLLAFYIASLVLTYLSNRRTLG